MTIATAGTVNFLAARGETPALGSLNALVAAGEAPGSPLPLLGCPAAGRPGSRDAPSWLVACARHGALAPSCPRTLGGGPPAMWSSRRSWLGRLRLGMRMVHSTSVACPPGPTPFIARACKTTHALSCASAQRRIRRPGVP